MPDYNNPKVDRLMGNASALSAVSDFTLADFLALAAAALDQAGCTERAVICALETADVATSPFRKPQLKRALEELTTRLRAEERSRSAEQREVECVTCHQVIATADPIRTPFHCDDCLTPET